MSIWGSPVKSMRALGTALTILLAIQIVLLGSGSVTHAIRIRSIDRIFAGEPVSRSTWDTVNGFMDASAGIGFLVFIACVVVWLVWQYRGQSNAVVFTGGITRYSPAWAVGWWLIPFADLVMPLLTMRELWRTSAGRDRSRDQHVPAIVPAWWVAWIPFLLTGLGLSGGGTTYAAMRSNDRLAIASAAFGIVAGAFAIRIVRSISDRQDAAASEVPHIPPPPTAGRPAIIAPAPGAVRRVPGQPATMLRTGSGVGRWLRISLAAQATMTVISAVASFDVIRTHTFVVRFDPNGGTFSSGSLPFDVSIWPVSLVAGVLSVTSIVLWLVWQHRATSNLWAWGVVGLRVTPGWSVGWWFIPFANLGMPLVAVRELDRRSRPDGEPRPRGGLLGGWWACFLTGQNGSWIALTVAFVAAFAGSDPGSNTVDFTPSLRSAAPWMLAASLVYAVAAVLAILVVRRIDAAQTDLLDRAVAPPIRPDAVPV